jgi:hypothetical protein
MSVLGSDKSVSVINFDAQNDAEDIYSDGTVQALDIQRVRESTGTPPKLITHGTLTTHPSFMNFSTTTRLEDFKFWERVV